MPTVNGTHLESGLLRYDDYENTPESPPQMHHAQWRHDGNAAHPDRLSHDDVTYQTPLEQRASYQIGRQPRMRSQNQDAVSRHLLYETAMLDTKLFEVLAMDEVDALKKEHARLNSRIDAAQRKLALETKVRDAAQNLQRLYSQRGRGRADTPQNPDSPMKTRRSLLGHRQSSGSSASGGGESLSHAEEELASSAKKVEELNETIKRLLERLAYVERKLLKHTAAILAQQQEQQAAPYTNGHRDFDDDAVSIYEPDEFDGIRDILGGKTINKLSKRLNSHTLQEEHEGQLQGMQDRLVRLNVQMRAVLEQASQSRGASAQPEPYEQQPEDVSTGVEHGLERLENTMRALEREQEDTRAHYAQVQDSVYKTRNAVEEQMQGINTSLYNTLLLSPAAQSMSELESPPQVTGHSYQYQIQYLEDTLLGLEMVLQKYGEDVATAQDNHQALAKSAASAQKLDEYEATVGGLWEILQSEDDDRRDSSPDGASGSRSPLIQESFSLAAFNSRVQHLIQRASSAREQHDILKRQIQQQRELNNKSDEEKDRHIVQLQDNHSAVLTAHTQLQDDLAKSMADHATSQSEASMLRAELENVETEFEQLKNLAETRNQEREEMSRQLQTHSSNNAQADAQLRDAQEQHVQLSSQLIQLTSARDTAHKDMEGLNSEVVQLKMDLAMARAELDGAYGSRAERAREAQAGEVDMLKEHSASLEKELSEMTAEFQDLTRESLELERERSQMDALIDGLRERCETLESQLSDEKVRWLGAKSPTSATEGSVQRETTTTMVLRQEFKKMMRETRAEGVRLLRAEQEERRKLEADLRRSRQANTPLARGANGVSATLA